MNNQTKNPPLKFGYGEDTLTFIALNYRLSELLELLGDRSSLEAFYYRPSLGRGLNFGEFDGIISTDKSIYLIEAKWLRTTRTNVLSMSDAQLRRHEIFIFFLDLWRNSVDQSDPPNSWNDFLSVISDSDIMRFEKKFSHKFPDADTLLVRNLFFLLNSIRPFNKAVINVALIHRTLDVALPTAIAIPNFRPIVLMHSLLSNTGFIELP